MTRKLPLGLTSLFLLLCLTACGETVRTTTRTETVEVPTPVALDKRLTTAPAEPELLPPDARNRDLAAKEAELRAWGRRMVAMLNEIAGLQPKD